MEILLWNSFKIKNEKQADLENLFQSNWYSFSANILTLLIVSIAKSLQIEVHSTNLSKVNKSQNNFSWNSIAQKNEWNIRQNSALESKKWSNQNDEVITLF